MTTTTPGPNTRTCTHWLGDEQRFCWATDGVRRYLTGMRCPQHTPAALAGRPESTAGGAR